MVRQIFATRGLLLATFVIGDIHGRADLVRSLLPKLEIAESDDVVFLGDYIDRGPDSRGVIDALLHFTDETPRQSYFLAW